MFDCSGLLRDKVWSTLAGHRELVSRVVCAAQLRWWRVGVPFFRDLVAFPKISEMDGTPDGGDDEERRREARTGGQREAARCIFKVGSSYR